MSNQAKIAELNEAIQKLSNERDTLAIADAQEAQAAAAASPIVPAAAAVADGTSTDVLGAMQQSQSEVSAAPTIRPADLDGASNIVAKDNIQLTAELSQLAQRFNALNKAKFNGEF